MIRMGHKILVIEDDPSAARLVEYALEREGYEVVTAQNGVEGLRKVKEDGPDLVVLDVLLPGLDGFELCHRLRADPRTKDLPVLMLSGKVRETDRATGLKVGADEYLTKPADPGDLTSRVETLLARRNAEKARVVGFVGCQPGVGTSTVAVNVAVSMSREKRRTILVDLSQDCTTIPALLALEPERSITKLIKASTDGVEDHSFVAIVTDHYSGLRVLSRPREAAGGGELSTAGIAPLFQGIKGMAGYVIVDISGRPSEQEKAALENCDVLVIVTGSDSTALSDTRSRAAELGKLGLDQGRCRVVVIDRDDALSDVEFSRMGPIVESVIQVPLLGIVPHDLKVPLECEARGLPVVLAEPNRPISVALREVAERLAHQDAETPLDGVAGGGRGA